MSSKMMVFTGNANPALARKVADRLYLGMGNAAVAKFSDGEITAVISPSENFATAALPIPRYRRSATLRASAGLAFPVNTIILDDIRIPRKMKSGWGGRIRTSEWRDQNPLPCHLATPQSNCFRDFPHRGECIHALCNTD